MARAVFRVGDEVEVLFVGRGEAWRRGVVEVVEPSTPTKPSIVLVAIRSGERVRVVSSLVGIRAIREASTLGG